MIAEGGEAGATDVNPLAPFVTITSPVEVTDPNTGPVVLENVHVVCHVTKGSDPAATVAASKVFIESFDAKGASIQKVAGSQGVQDSSEFTADFVFTPTQVPNGAISFRCTASDMSTPPNSGSASVNTLIDHGPTITVISPVLPNQGVLDYFPLGTVPFKFTVLAAPLSAADTQADVGQVTLTVNNVEIDLSSAETGDGSYSVDVNLNDPVQFKTTPNGPVSVVITATNKRAPRPVDHPDPVMMTVAYNFGVDGAGPKITILSPSITNSPVVGRLVKLEFTVVDAQSGVDRSTISVTLNAQETHVFDLKQTSWTRNGDTYDFTITDTTAVMGADVQLSVDVEATDKAKNKALAATAQYWIDTTPPTVDLDPPLVEEVKPSGVANSYYCSSPFDPLGISPGDGETVLDSGIYRALVWDETNHVANQRVWHYSGVDPSSVRLYLQDDPTQPFLISTHGGSVCDEIAIAGDSGVTHPPIPFALGPLDLSGVAYYGPIATPISNAKGTLCTPGVDSKGPDHLCSLKNSDMTRIINHNLDAKEDVVYTLTSGVALECTGKDLVIAGSVPNNGWVCLAARAVDFAGNVAISAPIRVCLNAANRPTPACANSSVDMPTCVDGCSPPPHFAGADPLASLPYVTSSN